MGFVHSKCNRIRINRPTGIESDLKPYKQLPFINITFGEAKLGPQWRPETPNTSLFPGENGGTVDFPGASKPTSGAQKTRVFIEWGAIWSSLGPLMRTKGTQDQFGVIILLKNMRTSVFLL